MRSKAYATFCITIFATLGVIGFVGTAAADDDSDSDDRHGNKGRLSAKAEIEELMSCYAYSFDAIARATDALPDITDLYSEANIDRDPNYAEGLKRFRKCTTDDWFIEGFDIDGNTIIAEGDIPPGPLPWVNVVNFFARIGMQTNSQHLYGSFSTTVRGRHGTVKAYAIITTYTADGTATTATSTYTSDVVYRRGKWLLKKTTFVTN